MYVHNPIGNPNSSVTDSVPLSLRPMEAIEGPTPQASPTVAPEGSPEVTPEVTQQAFLEIPPEAFLQASTMVSPQATLQAALQYAARQWPVVPLHERDKSPLTQHGLKEASLDEQTIRTWLHDAPRANLGIRTGAKPEGAGILVVDIDKDHGGTESLQMLEQEHGQLPATVEVITGGGGRHLYFRYPEGVQLGNSAGKLGQGLDTRGDDGYIVAPPSVHPCGRPYAWKEGHSPEEMDLAELPTWMITLLTSKPQANPEHLPVQVMPREQSRLISGDMMLQADLDIPYSNASRALEEMLRIKPREDENDGSRRLYAWACRAVEYDLCDKDAIQIIRLAEESSPFPRQYSDQEIQDRLRDAAINSQVKRGSKWRLVLDHEAPLHTAWKFLQANFTHQAMKTLYDFQDQLLAWNGGRYVELDESGLRSMIYAFTQNAQAIVRVKRCVTGLEPFNPDSTKVNRIIDAITACIHLDHQTQLPSWLWPQHQDPLLCTDPDPRKLIVMKNGLFDLENGKLLAHTPRFLNRSAGDFDYVPQAPEPKLWLKFLHDLWGDDKESIRLLQQWFGYCLTSDTSQQKILLMDGPKRAGKGTIGRVLTALLGDANVVSPSLTALTVNFGLWPMVDKSLATITDAHLSSKSDQTLIVDRLLAISGEDQVTIDRKYLKPWTGRLNIRFMISTNGMLKFTEASGALASRFLILKLVKTFIGCEDTKLTDKLLQELPGIFLWAVEGWRDLQKQGRFTVPQSSSQAMEDMENLFSPIRAYVQDRCEVGSQESALVNDLYMDYRCWCGEEGWEHPTSKQMFCRDLKSYLPGLQTQQHQLGTRRPRYYHGIGLKTAKRS